MPHIHEKIDFTVEVFIIHKNKVFLRKHDKYKLWLSVGGHIELDEDPTQAAVREVKEETGLDVTLIGEVGNKIHTEKYNELLPPRFLNRHRVNETHEHVTMVYFASSKTDKIKPGKGEKETECRWFTKDEIADPKFGLAPHVKFYALAALKAAV